ncbi:MAG TPA: alpha/beta hydrolase [Microvirga sp.]|jgi:pimeloyl-ACP methyl ester carboxylesterase
MSAPAAFPVGSDTFPLFDVGAGPPVLFLHGALSDLRLWLPHVERLQGRFRCLAMTQRWFGTTAWRANGPSFGIDAHANDLVALVRALETQPVSVVAWSYAGHAAIEAVRRAPELFAGVLAYEPGIRSLALSDDETAELGADAGAMFGPVFGAVGSGDLEGAVRLLIDGSGGAGYYDAQPEAARTIHRENAHTLPLLLAQTEPPAASPGLLQAMPRPIAIYRGGETRPLFRIQADAVARCLPGGRHRIISGSGHLWPEQDPAGFADAVEAWLNEAV